MKKNQLKKSVPRNALQFALVRISREVKMAQKTKLGTQVCECQFSDTQQLNTLLIIISRSETVQQPKTEISIIESSVSEIHKMCSGSFYN